MQLVCPNCGAKNQSGRKVCRECGFNFTEDLKPRHRVKMAASSTLTALGIIAMAVILCVALYKAYYWLDGWRTSRLYTSGQGYTAPTIQEYTMDDGRNAHAIIFYGSDGDVVFIPELNKGYRISGTIARVEIPDSDWFEENPEEVEYAEIDLNPILMHEGGEMTRLPEISLKIDTPVSPMTLINPASDYETVYTSVYQLQLNVVPGSILYVNGEDVSDDVDFQGNLDVSVNVYPQGDNDISVLVDTPNHKELRKDIDLYRAPQDIKLEPVVNVATSTNSSTVTIAGVVDPTATLSVDTDYVEGSIEVDKDGNFTFDAKMSDIGDNTVTFRASKEGKTDSVLSLQVKYVPTLKEYSDKAWAMDYENLKLLSDIWEGRIFLCSGEVVNILEEDDAEIIIMNVGKNGARELVALENDSTKVTEIEKSYNAYADVVGLYFYESDNIPYLIARYIRDPSD